VTRLVYRIRLKTTQHFGNGMSPCPGEDGRGRCFYGGPYTNEEANK